MEKRNIQITKDGVPTYEVSNERPAFIDDDHLEYLDGLRESGIVNMFGAATYLKADFGLQGNIAREVLTYWMRTFGTGIR